MQNYSNYAVIPLKQSSVKLSSTTTACIFPFTQNEFCIFFTKRKGKIRLRESTVKTQVQQRCQTDYIVNLLIEIYSIYLRGNNWKK